ncbi:aldehyde dehydrogenase (NADP(+)) [Parafilimonas sp.]|uniref:aldehyde dehydrogenase (NADP(+)) n=1 Tax=Parafilimonas sp. TaxID=1969739 RepID=UPI0039E56ED4
MQQTLNAEKNTAAANIDGVMQNALYAFNQYKKFSSAKRAAFLETIADEIEKLREQLVPLASEETNLPLARLNGEISRTTGQLTMFAALIKEGSWVEASIDTADANRTPPKPDIRKMLVPVGPVVVFGASNFPFAFSTAGGDTASVLASGSSVVIKAHPAHPETSALVFSAMQKAIAKTGIPQHTVQHVTDTSNDAGKALVIHPHTKGVGFTGSFAGGKALVEYARQREIPIPVFAEMGSINPVVFYPDTLSKNAEALAAQYAASITLGVGQFCTNPGLLLGIKSKGFDNFLSALGKEITKVQPQKMLHSGICFSYKNGLSEMLEQQGLQVVAQSSTDANDNEAVALVASVDAKAFLSNKHFTEEVFGPYSLAIICDDAAQLKQCLQSLNGQLTSGIMATEKDVADYTDVIEWQHTLAGRILLNNAPTGVEVCASMVHGGPYPATTDARFTSVGTTAIKRWVRPIALQNFFDAMLPDELKNDNPLGILRLIDNVYTRDAVRKA